MQSPNLFQTVFHIGTVVSVSYTHLDVYKRQSVEYSRLIGFGEDQLRERGNLPATFYVLTRVDNFSYDGR